MKKSGGKTVLIVVICILAALVIGEVILRTLGFGNALLYYNNDFTGYNMQPNQDLVRFGKHIAANEYSMRSKPLGEGENRILVFGDSVVNGGTYTDNESLATTVLENELKQITPDVRVLNISCGGWGIDNAYGYLRQYGNFGAKTVVLVFSNHDAVGTISDLQIAGTVNFPDRQYRLAWLELLERYVLPRMGIYLKENVDSTDTSSGNEFSAGWNDFYRYCAEHDINLIIYLHAQKNEVEEFGTYNDNGKRIMEFAEAHDVPVYTDLENEKPDDFRDWIHLTEKGQHVISDVLYPALEDIILRQEN